MWFAQGGKLTSIVEGNLVEGCDATCNLSEEKIPYSEIQNGSKWEADHIIPWSKGGRTISENGQLIAKRINRAKSDSVDFVEEFPTDGVLKDVPAEGIFEDVLNDFIFTKKTEQAENIFENNKEIFADISKFYGVSSENLNLKSLNSSL